MITTVKVKCYQSHLPLPVGKMEIYGGSCLCPSITSADVYIGLDPGMCQHQQRFPWVRGAAFLFEIPNMGVPGSVRDFRRLVAWTISRMAKGDRVHVGCIGGHGRTGLVLASVVRVAMKERDAISYVREHYCERAVESDEQVAWLSDVFDVVAVSPSRRRTTAEVIDLRGFVDGH